MIYEGHKITALRKAKGWSGAKLAREAGIKPPSLWALEHQVTKNPRAETLFRLAAALGVHPREFMRPTKKGDGDLLEILGHLFERLDGRNQQTLLAVARSLLESQK